MKTTEQLLRLIEAGAHLDLRNGTKMTNQLVQLAKAARAAGTTIIISDDKTTDQLVEIAKSGGGCVTVAAKE